ncbi:unnamed protein product, partial [Didymodactylos carnosus]
TNYLYDNNTTDSTAIDVTCMNEQNQPVLCNNGVCQAIISENSNGIIRTCVSPSTLVDPTGMMITTTNINTFKQGMIVYSCNKNMCNDETTVNNIKQILIESGLFPANPVTTPVPTTSTTTTTGSPTTFSTTVTATSTASTTNTITTFLPMTTGTTATTKTTTSSIIITTPLTTTNITTMTSQRKGDASSFSTKSRFVGLVLTTLLLTMTLRHSQF